nr:hypothetical protein CFP56_31577 [Quercus suber]
MQQSCCSNSVSSPEMDVQTLLETLTCKGSLRVQSSDHFVIVGSITPRTYNKLLMMVNVRGCAQTEPTYPPTPPSATTTTHARRLVVLSLWRRANCTTRQIRRAGMAASQGMRRQLKLPIKRHYFGNSQRKRRIQHTAAGYSAAPALSFDIKPRFYNVVVEIDSGRSAFLK